MEHEEYEFYLVSSNENKLKEFQNIFPDLKILKGKDLKEIKADAETVVIYKILEAKKNYKIDKLIIEDTILEIDSK